MEALEFLKAAKRRYENELNGYEDVIYLTNLDFDMYVKEVEEWAKEHPIKTRQTELIKIFPNVPIRSDGYVDITPCSLDAEVYRKCSESSMGCDKCYKEFWGKGVK